MLVIGPALEFGPDLMDDVDDENVTQATATVDPAVMKESITEAIIVNLDVAKCM